VKLTIITVNNQEDYNSWRNASSEFITFVPPGHTISEGYFDELVSVFTDRPLFRKLSMVSPSIDIEGESPVFGWMVSQTSILPSRIRSSTEPYAVQIGYLPGAVIKKTALERLQPQFTNADVDNSINLSLDLWDSGLRCFIHPKIAIQGEHRHGIPFNYQPVIDEKVKKIWKREMVG
jgi:hypothetical protein